MYMIDWCCTVTVSTSVGALLNCCFSGCCRLSILYCESAMPLVVGSLYWRPRHKWAIVVDIKGCAL